MQRLIQDIKEKNFKPVYLLYGEEDYLRKQYRDKLKNALVNDGDTLNYHYFEGKNVNVGEIIDLAETMPFLAEKRVIIMENTELVKADADRLAEYLKDIAETVILILVETKTDKRSVLYKAIQTKGTACEFKAQDENTLKRWIASKVKAENKNITMDAVNMLLDMTGSDMANISSELEKLFSYTLKKDNITREDVETICTKRLNNIVFELAETMANKQQKKALDLYHGLLAQKETSLGLLALISRHFTKMLEVKEMGNNGYHYRTIAEKLGLHPYVTQKYESQASKYKLGEIRGILQACADTDAGIKSGKIDKDLAVELIIIEYSR